MVYLASSKCSESKRFVRRLIKAKRNYIQYLILKLSLLLQLKHGFCRQNGPELGQVQKNEMKKWWLSLFAWMVYVVFQMRQCCIALTKMEAICLYLLTFWRDVVNAIYLKCRSSSNHAGNQEDLPDAYYDDRKPYMVLSKKQVSCKVCKRTPKTAA